MNSARHTEAELCLSDRAVVVVPCFVFLAPSMLAALKLGQLRLQEIECCAGVGNVMSSTWMSRQEFEYSVHARSR